MIFFLSEMFTKQETLTYSDNFLFEILQTKTI